MRILFFGDSVVDGRWDSQGGWVERLKREYNQLYLRTKDYKNNCHQVINLGIGGDTSSKLLRRIKNESEARFSASWPFVFVIGIGANDSRFVNDLDTEEVPKEDFEKNLEKIIAVAKEYTNKILFVGLSTIAENQIQFKNLYYQAQRIKEYDDIISKVAKKHGIIKVEVLKEFGSRNKSELLFDDKLHPNDAGHELIANTVKPQLEVLLSNQD
jgi:lysophospholipase L1-like esterase